MTDRQTRRRYLTAIGTATAVGLAGCSDDGTSGETATSGTATGTEDSSDQATTRVEVISAVGADISDGAIGSVEITVGKATESGNIDLSATTLQFVHASGSTDLTFGSTGGSGSATAFGVESIQDEDGSLEGDAPTLNDAADRAQLVLDTGAVTGDGLGEGETATVSLTTQSGGTTQLSLAVPETLSGTDAVDIYESSEPIGEESTDSEDTSQETNQLNVVGTVGTVDGDTISSVEMTVGRAPGAGDIDLSQTTIAWVATSGSYDLTIESSTSDEESFSVTTVLDEDGSIEDDTTLNDDSDRANIVIDLAAFGASLEEGSTATAQLTTASGGTTEVRLVVPETLSGSEAVSL